MSGPRVLGVHGIANFQAGLEPRDAAARLGGWWERAIRRGLPGDRELTVEVAYYAHHLRGALSQGADDIDDAETVEAWARTLGLPDEVAQGRLTQPARAALGWILRRLGPDSRVARRFVAAFVGEVDRYFTDETARKASVAVVQEAVARVRPDVLVAHSLGSVVTYEALWQQETDVPLLVTVGSPLAMPSVVLDRLAAHPGGRGRPPGVRRWINIADPGDVIAQPRGGVPVAFSGVTADLTDAVGAFDFHRATNYLACGAVSGLLAAAL